jgi:hypothetical protein
VPSRIAFSPPRTEREAWRREEERESVGLYISVTHKSKPRSAEGNSGDASHHHGTKVSGHIIVDFKNKVSLARNHPSPRLAILVLEREESFLPAHWSEMTFFLVYII